MHCYLSCVPTHLPSCSWKWKNTICRATTKCFYLHRHSDKTFTYMNTPCNLLPCLSTYFWPRSASLISPQRVIISSVSPPPHLSLSPLLFSLSHCLSCRPPSLPASSVILLSPSVVVLNKQQGVVGRGLHSRWVCESPAGGREGGWEHHSFSLALSLLSLKYLSLFEVVMTAQQPIKGSKPSESTQ